MITHVNWAEIDLDAIAHNVRQLKTHVGEQCMLSAVVKANAYAHGALQAAQVALHSGATRLCVARADEAVALRLGGITAPILTMGHSTPAQAADIVAHRITPAVADLELAHALSAAVAAAGGPPLPVHVKVDTGLGRFGLLPEEVLPFVRALLEVPGLFLEGVFTHFATADEADLSYARQQFAIYLQVLGQLQEAHVPVPIRHTANSAATLALPETHLDMVRCGIAVYGLRPSAEVKMVVPVRPAMSLKSRIARLRTLPAGACISYGCTYVTSQPTPVALVPIGYGDGYRRGLSNKGQVLVRGQRVPIIGRVCMDQFMVDVTKVPDAREGDEVVALGRQGNQEINAEEIGAWVGTNNYETVAAILPRVPRVYVAASS
jgi:alanine racemase